MNPLQLFDTYIQKNVVKLVLKLLFCVYSQCEFPYHSFEISVVFVEKNYAFEIDKCLFAIFCGDGDAKQIVKKDFFYDKKVRKNCFA